MLQQENIQRSGMASSHAPTGVVYLYQLILLILRPNPQGLDMPLKCLLTKNLLMIPLKHALQPHQYISATTNQKNYRCTILAIMKAANS